MARSIKQIENDLANAVNRVREAELAVAGNLASLLMSEQDARKRLNTQLAVHANDLRDRLAQLAPTLVAGWGDAYWNEFAEPPRVLAGNVRIGNISEPSTWAEPLENMPFMVPVLASNAPILVICDSDSAEQAQQVLHALILRIALTMPSEARFTLLDPLGLGAAFPMRSQLQGVRPPGRSSADELADVLADIRRVNENVVQHAASLAELPPDARAGEPFEFVAAVDFPQAYRNDPRTIDALVKIANSGPRAGRFLIMVIHTNQEMPRDFDLGKAFRSRETLNKSRPLGYN